MPLNGCINDQESLIGLKNGYIEGLKKISKENVVMKHGLQVFVRKRVKKIYEKWPIWVIQKFQIKKQSPKMESIRKTEQDSPY